MASQSDEVVVDLTPYFIIYKDGRINRFRPPVTAPTSDDPNAVVRSKDFVIQPETGVSVRLFLPKITNSQQKLPLVIYIHGGAFCIGSAKSPPFHKFISNLVETANVIAVSIDYRLAPEHPLPIAYDDSWDAFQWVISHVNGEGPESWLNEYADFGKVFLGGESAGTNIANDVAIRAGVSELDSNVKILGIFYVHPYFGVEDDKLYKFLCPNGGGCHDDPRLNPLVDPRLPSMACKRILFLLAEKDMLNERTRAYYEGLKKKKSSEWNGEVEMVETEGEGHCFHLFKTESQKALDLMDSIVTFLKQE